jgi:hypothetical protein
MQLIHLAYVPSEQLYLQRALSIPISPYVCWLLPLAEPTATWKMSLLVHWFVPSGYYRI